GGRVSPGATGAPLAGPGPATTIAACERPPRQLLLPARRRRGCPAAAQARAVPPRDGRGDARPRAGRPALAPSRRRAQGALAGLGAPGPLRRGLGWQAGGG